MKQSARTVVAAALLFALVYIALDFNKLYALRYGADTGAFLQFLTNEAHGRGSLNFMEYRPHLQVHDSWILLLLVPAIAAFPYAQTLLVLQCIAIAAAALPLYAFARECGASERNATIAAIAYLVAPCTQGLAYGNFLENLFVPLVAACACLYACRRSLLPSLLCAQVLLGLKEDQALFVLWFGVACAIWWDRRIGIAAAALAVANGLGFVLYEHLAAAQPSIPYYALRIDDPLIRLEFFAALLLPFAFAPLALGWRLLLAAPLVAELVFNGPWTYQIATIGTHWTAPALSAAAIATAYVVAKRPKFGTPVLILAVLCALTINDTALRIGRWPYVVEHAAYARAFALRSTQVPVTVSRADEGAYAVAAAIPLVRLAPRSPSDRGLCPGYDTNARAFLASLRILPWPRGVTLCGGVPVQR